MNISVTTLPGPPANWNIGSIKGARLRDGITPNVFWSGGSLGRVHNLRGPLSTDGKDKSSINHGGKVAGQSTSNGGPGRYGSLTKRSGDANLGEEEWIEIVYFFPSTVRTGCEDAIIELEKLRID